MAALFSAPGPDSATVPPSAFAVPSKIRPVKPLSAPVMTRVPALIFCRSEPPDKGPESVAVLVRVSRTLTLSTMMARALFQLAEIRSVPPLRLTKPASGSSALPRRASESITRRLPPLPIRVPPV